ncbi:non-ribosomal peptide synthetase/type I polyketide synthase [Jannaschia seohaensis]|uniref:Amino acid adenylation domain-containing protein n=1 Tax=Jannaschia seohaensis TaxID=475081 RepID=A0A2Y9A231_9RHOB|nr:non-ribosomal peptide synthetase/type I polyketide synthase [Jannaschia seohaensis]PWJ22176.1 amino acid adenylation domain-containing protein [Jannaschia seohaensis]SSA38454.1 amino acid adenylation domain-containing protein [Jannaschia seohaensis]
MSGVPDAALRDGLFAGIAAQAARRPEAVAVHGAPARRYGELVLSARRIAGQLAAAGVAPGDHVALWGARSAEAIEGLLGILAAGAVAVPLDPSFAAERIGAIVADAKPRALLAPAPARAEALRIADCPVISPGDGPALPPVSRAREDPALILYTSGSTGRPKGVVLPHRALVGFEHGPGDLAVTAEDRVLHVSTPACDGAIEETLTPLLRGASIAVVPAGLASASAVAETIAAHRVTVATLYTGLLHLLIDHRVDGFAGVRLVMAGGEAMDPARARALLAAHPGLVLVNEYGPTETCCVSLAHRVTPEDLAADAPLPIGRPLAGEEVVLLDPDLAPVPEGAIGQIAIGGSGLALGYLGRPKKTAEAFIPDPRPGRNGRLYLTGDLGRARADGVLEFHGRVDRQVKLAGRRVELDGIEAALRAAPAVADAVVEKWGDGLVAFVVPATDGDLPALLRAQTQAADIHPHVFPRRIEARDVFPLRPNGKVDRDALRASLAAIETGPAPAAGNLRATVAGIWQEILGTRPAPADRFFDLGGTSLQLIEAHARIEAALDRRFDVAAMFDHPSLGGLCDFLAGADRAAPAATTRRTEEAIAIVGLAARLPGLPDLDAFWQATLEGRDSITRFAPEELEDGFDAETRARPDFVAARPILSDVDLFDARHFGMTPREAARTDPQARIFLELCAQALDHAGLDPTRPPGRVGVYSGASMSTYLLENLLAGPGALRDFTSQFQIDYTNLAGNGGDDIPARVAQKLGLTGPAVSITTACSTGLATVIAACDALRAGRIGAALAGGVSITFPQKRGYLGAEGGMVSLDGTCRPFDARANGTIFGDGAGVVVLKRLSDAERDGDTIHAVIRGTGQSNDGGRGMSFTAPSAIGQSEAIAEALADAGLTGDDIGYVECHGTATPLGDPVEIAGLRRAFAGATAPCALGAVKGNLGHLDAAAGIAGLIKAVLVLKHGTVPPIAHHRSANPQIDLSGTGFHLPTAPAPWTGPEPRRAGVSAFGVGGSNAHVVLEQAPARAAPAPLAAPVVLPLSAKTPEALKTMGAELADLLECPDAPALADVAHTLQSGRRAWDLRGGVMARDVAEAARALRRIRPGAPVDEAPRLVFLMPGQGAQFPGMGRAVTDPVFAEFVERGLAALPSEVADDLRPLLFGDPEAEDQAKALAQTRLAQPALLLVEVAAAEMWRARGVTPDLLIGHSVGEIAAAVIAGVMSFEDALRLVTERGALMQAQPSGGMLAVTAPMDVLAAHLTPELDLAAKNAPEQQVVAGPPDALDALTARLEAAGYSSRRLSSSHAFHSCMMDPIVPALRRVAASLTLRAPRIPLISTVTGRPMTEADATDPEYWAGQARACVDFTGALATLGAVPSVLLEAGPGRTLSALAPQSLASEAVRDVIPSLPDAARAAEGDAIPAQAALRLWRAGVAVDLSAGLPAGAGKVPLPSYPFARIRCWIDAPRPRAAAAPVAPVIPGASALPPLPLAASQTVFTGDPMSSARTVLPDVMDLVAEMSGLDLTLEEAGTSFLELGLDSLFLGQLTQEVGKQFKVRFGFRRLTSDLGTPQALADFILAENPDAAPQSAPAAAAPASAAQPVSPASVLAETPALSGDVAAVMQAQMQTMQALFAQQLAALGRMPAQAPAPAPTAQAPVAAAPAQAAAPETDAEAPAPKPEVKRRAKMQSNADLTPAQKVFARDLARRYSECFPSSKAYTDRHRPVLADPRAAAGFHPDWKELAFPIVADRAKGAYIHDLDGHAIIDLVNGFGQTAFGHAPDFVGAAVAKQLEKGYAIGPQAERAGPLAERFAKAVGHERVTFCNTGTEAVIAACRIARTATGRDKVVLFDKSYHGQHDEVLAKPGKGAAALPSVPGIPRGAMGNVVMLGYDDPAALDWIAANTDEIAAVLIEPVRSRYPASRPEAFVRRLKELTRDSGAALIIDEVVTGFRTGPRGMQGVWGIQGDIAVYGKVVGGGMPIGVVAGDARFMDALDGGSWSFGDDSRPEAMPTFVAGTFVRHPLVLAAVEAVLDELERNGDALFVEAPARLADMAARMRAALAARGLPDMIEDYSTWLYVDASDRDPRATLLYPLMRLRDVHVMDGFCWFLTTEHGTAEIDHVVRAFEESLDELLSVGILADERAADAPPLPRREAAPAPLLPGQREIWMRHQLGGLAAASFNESGTLWIDGLLDRAALQAALDELVARRDALRARFARDGSGFRVADPETVPLEVHEDADETALAAYIAQDAATPFDLTQGAPFRVALFRLAPERHSLVLTAHHIVLDGWSFGLVVDDLSALYAAAAQGRDAALEPAPSLADHARAAPVAPKSHAAYWRRVYAELPAPVDLPADRPRRPAADRPGATIVHEMPMEVIEGLKAVGARNSCTLFSAAFAGMQLLVHRLTGASDIVLGVPTATQQSTADPDLVGHLVNFLPIRAGLDPAASVADHLRALSARVGEALEHDGLTFGEILTLAEVPRSLDRTPLTSIEFNLEQAGATEWHGATARFETNPKAAVTFDLFFNLVTDERGLRVEAHYASDLFDAATIRAWAAAYECLLRAMAADPAATLTALPLPDAAEAPAPTEGGAPLPERLEQVARDRADAPAVTGPDDTLTHAQLWARSGAYAAALQARTRPGDRVAICLPRGADLIAATLGVLRAGCAFVPLDPGQPDMRLHKILEDADPALVLTDTCARFDRAILSPEDVSGTPRFVALSKDAPAYVIYTSGSTGTPKGVEVPHGALTNLLDSMIAAPGLSAESKLLSVTTPAFDISILEMFGPLLAGGQVEVAPAEMVLDAFKLADRLRRGDVTHMQATPTLWAMLDIAGWTPPEDFQAWAGGEPLAPDLADRLMSQGAALWNLYGPTETTIWSAAKRLTPGAAITIGDPVARTELHVLDAAGRPCPVGVEGELNIGGAGLALGYAGQPERTAEAFRRVEIGGMARRLYATGDLARRRADGEIEILGRRDGQIKLRGYRIDLGEIEAALRAQPGVTGAAVALHTREGGDKQLVGYVTGDAPEGLALAEALRALLPDYMVPTAWMRLDALPQTQNGKLDRKALPAPEPAPTGTLAGTPLAPGTETRLAAIWSEVLGREVADATATLLQLGADSLSIFRLAARLLSDGYEIEARHLFEHPTIRDLAAFHDARDPAAAPARPKLSDFRRGARRSGSAAS